MKIAILGYGPIPEKLAHDLNQDAQVELFTSQNVKVNDLKVSDYRSLLTKTLDFDVLIFAWRGIPKARTEKAAVLRRIVDEASPETLIINMSSVSVYGQNSSVNTEETEPHPINDYGYSKLFLERYLNIFAESRVCNLRISNVFGHPDFDDVINRMLKNAKLKCLTKVIDPEHVFRDFISIDSVVKAIHSISYSNEFLIGREIYNLSSGVSISLRCLLDAVQSKFEFSVDIQEQGLVEDVIKMSLVSNNKFINVYPSFKFSEDTELENYLSYFKE